MADDRLFLLFVVVCLTVASFAVIRIREGTTGRFLQALHMSPSAAASIGISGTRARIVAFTVAAALAGFGGGLMSSYVGQASYEANFAFLFGLVWVAIVVSSGARSVQAAVMSGLFFYLMPALLQRLFSFPGNLATSNPDLPGPLLTVLEAVNPGWALPVAFILFGFGAIMYARHPEGSIEAQTRIIVDAVLRRIDRRRGVDGDGDGGPDDGSVDGSSDDLVVPTSGVRGAGVGGGT